MRIVYIILKVQFDIFHCSRLPSKSETKKYMAILIPYFAFKILDQHSLRHNIKQIGTLNNPGYCNVIYVHVSTVNTSMYSVTTLE